MENVATGMSGKTTKNNSTGDGRENYNKNCNLKSKQKTENRSENGIIVGN